MCSGSSLGAFSLLRDFVISLLLFVTELLAVNFALKSVCLVFFLILCLS